ncbi:MAG: Fe-S protein assembly co-chaperone HscB [Phycisphaerae bacterium]|nr:Fe-S protein assembly co-chaperone HscB [Phycisphaerae bacterium]
MDSPIACSTCGALSQLPADSFDSFELFSINREYDIDPKVLHHKYLCLSRVIHPDLASGEAGHQRSQSLNLSAELNRAYDTLRDPVARAEYLLSLAGGPRSFENKTVPQELLVQVLEFREEIEDARASDDTATLQAIQQQLLGRREATLARIAELARGLETGDPQNRIRLREQLNTVKYWNNILEQIPPTGVAGRRG